MDNGDVESRRDFLQKLPRRAIKIGAVGLGTAVVANKVISGIENSPQQRTSLDVEIDPGIKSELDKMLEAYAEASKNGNDGSRGIILAQYGIEADGVGSDKLSYFNSVASQLPDSSENLTGPINMAYAGIMAGSDIASLSQLFSEAKSKVEHQEVATDLTAISVASGIPIESLVDTFGKVSNFSGLRSFGLIDSHEAISVLTGIASHDGIDDTESLFMDINSKYEGRSNLSKAILTLSARISGDVSTVMENFRKVTDHEFTNFNIGINEENEAMLALATSTGAFTAEQVINMHHYLAERTNFGDGDIARLIVGLASAKTDLPIVSRLFEVNKSAKDVSTPVLLAPIQKK
jgi:hypothetical protein